MAPARKRPIAVLRRARGTQLPARSGKLLPGRSAATANACSAACACPQVAVYGAFGAELFAMFVIGEIVGRGGTLTGYDY